MNKKICLVTWYNLGHNYGTMLQAFAMQNIIRKLGYNSEIIKYEPKNISLTAKIKKRIAVLYFLIFNNHIFKRNKKMDKWIKQNIILSKKYNSIEELSKDKEKYLAGICGSDQIWNNNNNIIDGVYYLQFLDEFKRIAYSPSIGREYISNEVKPKFIKYVSEIKYLSIREKKGAEIIKELTGKDCQINLDPTLLINKQEWLNLLNLKENKDQDYIFVYLLTENNKTMKLIDEYARDRNLNIKVFLPKKNSNYINPVANPKEFLTELLNAKYIITDSYHGMLFSLNFEKQFLIYKRFEDNDPKNQNSRIYNILEELKINNRLIDRNTIKIDKVLQKNISYNEIRKILEKKRENSLNFLKDSLDKIKKEVDKNDM